MSTIATCSTNHLLPRLARLRLSQIDYGAIDRYIEAKQLEREGTPGGAPRGPAARPQRRPERLLANSTINATLELLSGILDEAVRRKVLPTNPARERACGSRSSAPGATSLRSTSSRTCSRLPQELDQKVTPRVLERGAAARALRDQGIEWKEIARRWRSLRPRRSTTPSRTRGTGSVLGGPSSPALRLGLRNTELCRVDVRDVDFAHGHINVEDAKTDAGIRKVDLSPMLLDDLLAWRASLNGPGA